MEAWSEWLLESLVTKGAQLELCTTGELNVLMQDRPQPGPWWIQQLAESPQAVSHLIRLANSAAYASGRPTRSLEDAVLTLGHTTARHALFQSLVERLFPARGREWLTQASRWRHVLAVAAVSASLARALKLDAGELFVAGLFHDLGQTLLHKQGGEPYLRLESTFGQDPDPHALARAEEAHLGFDHATLSAALAAHLGMPASVVSLLRDHHRLEAIGQEIAPGSHLKRVAVLELAHVFAEALGYGSRGAEGAINARQGWLKLLRETADSPLNRVLKLGLPQLWWLSRKAQARTDAVMCVARGGEGLLWEGPTLLERLGHLGDTLEYELKPRLQRVRERLVRRLEALKPARIPAALPAPVTSSMLQDSRTRRAS